jgi:hypothetical protein
MKMTVEKSDNIEVPDHWCLRENINSYRYPIYDTCCREDYLETSR